MNTIVAIDLGKRKSVLCTMDRSSLKTQYKTVRTQPEVFHDLFVDLDVKTSIVLFEVGNQAGWLSDMLRGMELDFKVANTNDPAWKWTNHPIKSDKKDALRLAMMYHQGFFPEVYMPQKAVRQKRMLIGYRQSLTDRLTQIKNSIRAIICTMAMDWPAGKSGWTKKRLAELAEHARSLDAIDDACDFWRGQLYVCFKYKLALLSQCSDEALLKQRILSVEENGKIVWKGKKTVDFQQIRERFDSLEIKVDWKRREGSVWFLIKEMV